MSGDIMRTQCNTLTTLIIPIKWHSIVLSPVMMIHHIMGYIIDWIDFNSIMTGHISVISKPTACNTLRY